MELCGCTVVEIKSTKSGDIEYFPFVISHDKSPISYKLAATSKKDTDDWIKCIREVSTRQPTNNTNQPIIIDRLLDRRIQTTSTIPIADNIVNSEATLNNIPILFQNKIEVAINALLQSVDEKNEKEWEPMFDKNGVIAYRKSNTGVITVKGEGIINYPLINIFELILNNQIYPKDIDSQIQLQKIIKSYSNNTNVLYRKTTQVCFLNNSFDLLIFNFKKMIVLANCCQRLL